MVSEKNRERKIFVATGGSGGHIIPALSVAEVLREQGCRVMFVGVLGPLAGLVKSKGFESYELPAKGLTAKTLARFFVVGTATIKSIVRAVQLIREHHPESVVGFGGYGAFSVVAAACLLRVPTMIHEQNVQPGRANALLARCVQKVTISFAPTQDKLKRKAVLTGCPCRYPKEGISPEEARRQLGLKEGCWTILVFGGSQGSQRINKVFLETAALIAEAQELQVIHIAGVKEAEGVKEKYALLGISAFVFSFLLEMDQAYTAADVVVCRAGAVTVSELIAFAKKAVVIPYPFAGGHQKDNAAMMVERGSAEMIEEAALSAGSLKAAIMRVNEQNSSTIKMSGEQKISAAQKIAAEVLTLV